MRLRAAGRATILFTGLEQIFSEDAQRHFNFLHLHDLINFLHLQVLEFYINHRPIGELKVRLLAHDSIHDNIRRDIPAQRLAVTAAGAVPQGGVQ